jgi:serine O-acetyltransferase
MSICRTPVVNCSIPTELIEDSGPRAALRRIPYFFTDVRAIWRKDPALRGGPLRALEVVLYASFWAMLFHRVAHATQALGIPFFPRLISQIARFLTGIEIHPGAVIGKGLFIDHGMGVVIGETAILGSDVLLFHGVTLGGVGAEPGRRHPKLGDGVLVGAGAKVLGAITIGAGARIGAQAVVLTDVPPLATAVGVPAKSRVHPPGDAGRVSACRWLPRHAPPP